MKSVKDIAKVAHNWANQIGDNAQASHLFFEGDDIYSYGRHFLIARHIRNEAGSEAVLMTRRSYSKSTSAHVTLVKMASRHLNIINVPDPALPSGEIFEKWYNEIKGLAGCLDSVRKPEKYLLEIQSVFEAVKCYAHFFGYHVPEILVEAGKIKNIDQYQKVIEKEKALRKAQAQREQAEQQRIQKISLKNWRAFETNYLTTVDGFDYLRFNVATQHIETSQKVEIPAETGRQFYRLILSVIEQGGCKDCQHKLMGLYPVLEINSKFIRVGCHKISVKEIKLFTQKQNWKP